VNSEYAIHSSEKEKFMHTYIMNSVLMLGGMLNIARVKYCTI